MDELEEGAELQLDFTKLEQVARCGADVLPVAVQNADTMVVVLLAYMNEEALRKTVETRTLTLYSTSRDELWVKGATSGNTFTVEEVRVNCEQNSLLVKVVPRAGGICHTENREAKPRNCFYRRLRFDTWKLENLDP